MVSTIHISQNNNYFKIAAYALCTLFFAAIISLSATAATWYIANYDMEDLVGKINPDNTPPKHKTIYLASSTYNLKKFDNMEPDPGSLPAVNLEIANRISPGKNTSPFATEIDPTSDSLSKIVKDAPIIRQIESFSQCKW